MNGETGPEALEKKYPGEGVALRLVTSIRIVPCEEHDQSVVCYRRPRRVHSRILPESFLEGFAKHILHALGDALASLLTQLF